MAKEELQGTPLQAFRRIKSMMREHWLERLEQDLLAVESALASSQTKQPGESLPIRDDDDEQPDQPDEQTPPRSRPRK